MVSGVKPEQAKMFLHDIFEILIDTNRKMTKEVRLNLRFGCMRLYKNGELSFDYLSQNGDIESTT